MNLPAKFKSLFIEPRDPFLWVFGLTGILGFWTGIIHMSWQHAVEGAQVLAGVVEYPSASPHYIYQLKAWTLLHQIPAVFLKLGISEGVLSQVLSGVMCMLSYQCLALSFFTFSGDKKFAVLFPFLIDSLSFFNLGLSYPILLKSEIYTYGSIGLSWAFLAVLLNANKRRMLAGLMLGLLPAVHPGLGVLVLTCVFLQSLFFKDRETFKNRRWLAAGLLLSLLSFIYHHAVTLLPLKNLGLQSIPKDALVRFIEAWDGHRNSVFVLNPGTYLNLAFLAAGAFILKKHPTRISEEGSRFLKHLLSLSAVSLFFTFVWLAPMDALPEKLIQIMPTRLTNFCVFAAPALVLGLARRNKNFAGQLLFYGGLFILFVLGRYSEIQSHGYLTFLFAGFFLAAASFHLNVFKNIFPGLEFKKNFAPIKLLAVLYLSYKALVLMLVPLPTQISYESVYKDWRLDPALKAAGQHSGFLLPSPDYSNIQLITRRPVLVDTGALDILPYFPELGASMSVIVKKIYGFDLIPQGPLETYQGMHFETIHALWTGRTSEDWKKIGQEFGVTQILVPKWELQLPKDAQTSEYDLYRIPSQ